MCADIVKTDEDTRKFLTGVTTLLHGFKNQNESRLDYGLFILHSNDEVDSRRCECVGMWRDGGEQTSTKPEDALLLVYIVEGMACVRLRCHGQELSGALPFRDEENREELWYAIQDNYLSALSTML